jgi:hypothetical protein
MPEVRLPGNAIDTDATDVAAPAVALLRDINLLPTDQDMQQAGSPGAVLGGPPQSVALIEAGATAFAKWWAAGLGVTAAGIWGSIGVFWGDQPPETQRVLLWIAAVVSAALVLSLGLIIGADLRGRAAASVATIGARATVAETMSRIAQATSIAATPAAEFPITPLPVGTKVTYLTKPAREERDWLAVAMQGNADATMIKYLVIKGGEQAWAGAAELRFN